MEIRLAFPNEVAPVMTIIADAKKQMASYGSDQWQDGYPDEKSIFDELTKARKMIDEADTTKDAKTIDKAQDIITKAVESLKVIAESNPQIQASSLVSNMMDELRDTADKIMYSRRTFIDLSADYNLKISTIPGVWLAPIFGFKKQSGLSTPSSPDITSVSSDETKTPKVKI